MTRVTVQSIADELGLSKFAVSRALAGKSGVSAETRRLVTELAERKGYHPRGLKRQGNLWLTVLCPDAATSNRELWIDTCNGIEMQAMRDGYETRLVFCDDPGEVARLHDTSVGFILIGPIRREIAEAAQATGRPVVACNLRIPPLLAIDQVTGTDIESGELIGEYLLELGHRDIVYVHGQDGFVGRQARLDGLRSAVGDRARISQITMAEDYASADFSAALRVLIEDGARPTAFFCGSDGVGVTIQSELLRLGVRVPDDVSVIGHADYPLATQVSPQLTTIHVPHRQIGQHAVTMIRQRLGDAPHPMSLRVQLVGRLVERDSSAAPGEPDWPRLMQRAHAEPR